VATAGACDQHGIAGVAGDGFVEVRAIWPSVVLKDVMRSPVHFSS
jgi:hypothetical protein